MNVLEFSSSPRRHDIGECDAVAIHLLPGSSNDLWVLPLTHIRFMIFNKNTFHSHNLHYYLSLSGYRVSASITYMGEVLPPSDYGFGTHVIASHTHNITLRRLVRVLCFTFNYLMSVLACSLSTNRKCCHHPIRGLEPMLLPDSRRHLSVILCEFMCQSV